MSLNILLMSDEMIKERTALHGNVDPKLIYPDLKVAQDLYILPVIGTALYDKLQTAVNAADWTGLTDYKNLLDKYIIDALMWFTLAELPQTLGYQFWNKGVVRKGGTDTELPSLTDLVDISNTYRNRGEQYAKRLRLYLEANTALFPEYLNPGNTIDTVRPNRNDFSIPVYLGGSDCCNNEGGFDGQPYKP